jgi:quercetin dioxygenase-like cupin family protein
MESSDNWGETDVYFHQMDCRDRCCGCLDLRRSCAGSGWPQGTETKRLDRHQHGGRRQHFREPGETLARHVHHGEEAFYVLEGATAELPDGKQISLAAGSAAINVREVAHGGFKIVGDKTLKLLTVHVVDKGKPLYDAPK